MRRAALILVPLCLVFSASGASATPANNPITNGLVAAYEFSGNANDVSGNGNDGVVNGATLTTDRFGNANSAYSFDGVDDRIPVGGSLAGFDDYTQAAWFNLSGAVGTDPQNSILQTASGLFRYDGAANEFIITIMTDRQGGTTSNPHSAYGYDVPYAADDQTWYHIAITVGSDNTATLFLNGDVIGVGPRWFDAGGTGDVPATIVGAGFDNVHQSWNSHFTGSIDDVYMYDRRLSPSEVSTLYSVVPEPNTALLLGIGMMGLGMRRRRQMRRGC